MPNSTGPCTPETDTGAAKAKVLEFLRWNYSLEQIEGMLADIEVSKELVFGRIREEGGETFAAILYVTKYQTCQVSLVREVLLERKLLRGQPGRVKALVG